MNSGGNNGSNANYNNGYPAYPYGQQQYPDYYYQQQQYYAQYPPQPQQHIPQGDPSAALSTISYQYQQQYYNSDPYAYPASYYSNYYTNTPNQRSMLHYGDLSQDQQQQNKKEPPKKEPELLKPKFCCYRTLKSNMAVAQHEKLHVKCPTCDFMCLPSILQEHEETYHGKAPKESKKPARPDGVIPYNAPKISTQEELDAWIAARKKNWPTKTNIERKEQETAEKIARGELVPKQKRKQQQTQQQVKRQKVDEDEDEFMDPERDAISSKDPSSMGKILLPEDRPKRKCKYFMAGKCRNGTKCTFSHDVPERKQPRVVNPVRKRPNLLFKLLEKEIQQEKSVILQCLRYIVDNNFFEESTSKDEEQDVSAAETSAAVEESNEDMVEQATTDAEKSKEEVASITIEQTNTEETKEEIASMVEDTIEETTTDLAKDAIANDDQQPTTVADATH